MSRYFRLLSLQLRTSALLAAQYRVDFIVDMIISLFWTATAVIPLFVVYGDDSKRGIPGWSFGETLVVTACFILLQGVLDGAINPGLQAVIDHIRKGTLDFVLLKPADAQFLVSTSRFQLWRVFSLVNAGIVFVVAFKAIGQAPSVGGVLAAVLLFGIATLLLYSLWILIISAAFIVVKVDNLTYLFSSIFDAARWPSSVFKGAVKFVFTFVIPLAVMTTFPAEALLGRLEPLTLVFSILGAFTFAGVARAIWLRSIGHYTSAGG
ncbi:MAG TPA: ABC-2 family transporter protein [Archangium sp.]